MKRSCLLFLISPNQCLLFAVQSTSVASESVRSRTGKLFTDKRSLPQNDLFEARICSQPLLELSDTLQRIFLVNSLFHFDTWSRQQTREANNRHVEPETGTWSHWLQPRWHGWVPITAGWKIFKTRSDDLAAGLLCFSFKPAGLKFFSFRPAGLKLSFIYWLAETFPLWLDGSAETSPRSWVSNYGCAMNTPSCVLSKSFVFNFSLYEIFNNWNFED